MKVKTLNVKEFLLKNSYSGVYRLGFGSKNSSGLKLVLLTIKFQIAFELHFKILDLCIIVLLDLLILLLLA